MEDWKDIKGYEGLYQVSNFGRVKSLERKSDCDGRIIREKILKTGVNNPGYKFVILRKDGISKNRMIHRLVAEEFINQKGECINHLDGNKLNNHISNLEVCSNSKNRKHAYDNGLALQKGITKAVKVTNDKGKVILFETMNDVNKYFGFKKCWIHNRIRKYGEMFEYKKHLVEVV